MDDNMNPAADFIAALTGHPDTPVTFQTFDDSKAKRPDLARILHGTITQNAAALKELNDKGAGIFITVNETDLKGRKAWNVSAIRALFIDDDEGTVDPSIVPMPPSIVVQSARGRHIYWKMQPGQPIAEFEKAQIRLATALKTDVAVKDLSRVLRVPGFYHKKGEPFLISLLDAHGDKTYTMDQVVGSLPVVCAAEKHSTCPVPVAIESHDDDERFNRCRAYLMAIPGAVEGSNGDANTLRACMVAGDFGLDDGVFWPLLLEWNQTCSPPWEEKDLASKLRNAGRYRKESIGCRLDGSTPNDADISGILAQLSTPAPENEKQESSKAGIYTMLKNYRCTRGGEYKARPLADLMHPPGLLGEMASWINRCSHKPQPMFDLGASIVTLGAVLGRKVRSESNVRTNLYGVAVGGSSCGKNKSKECIKQLFLEISDDDSAINMLGDGFASGSAVEEAVAQSPARLYTIDEFGKFLESTKSQQSAGHVLEIRDMLLRMYTSERSVFLRRTYGSKVSNKDYKPILQPSLSVWGLTTPETIFHGIERHDIETGLIGRLLIFEADDNNPFPMDVDHEASQLPKSLVDGFKFWYKASVNPGATGDLETITHGPRPLVVRKTKAAKNVFDGLQMTLWEKAEEMGGEAGAWGRVFETGIKLALIRACGINPEHPEIDEDDARWGTELSYALTKNFLDRIEENVFESKNHENQQKLLTIIKKYRRGCSWSEIGKTRWGRNTAKRDRDSAMADLVATGEVVCAGSHPRVKHIFADFLKESTK